MDQVDQGGWNGLKDCLLAMMALLGTGRVGDRAGMDSGQRSWASKEDTKRIHAPCSSSGNVHFLNAFACQFVYIQTKSHLGL